MALNIPSFPSPYSSTPLANAYAWITGTYLDAFGGSGRFVVNVNPSVEDYTKQPVAQVSVSLGQVLIPADVNTPATTFPSLTDLMNDQVFADAYATIGAKLYQALKDYHPSFQGSTIV